MSEQQQHLRLRAVDSWFFRGARPMFLGEGGQSDIQAMFPPSPDTVVGAMRAAWAREMGWPGGRVRWSDDVMKHLGDGFKDDAFKEQALRFDGPHLITWASDAEPGGDVRLWYPMPLHLLGVGGTNEANEPTWTPTARLAPGEDVICDLGEVRLPEVIGGTDAAGRKPGSDFWVNDLGMRRILAGGLPRAEEIRHEGALWRSEHRVGLARDNTTRSAVSGMLYSTRHIRPHRCVGLGLTVHRAPKAPPRVLTLGGEGRLAECDVLGSPLRHPTLSAEALARAETLAVVLLTPARLPRLELDNEVPGLEGFTLVSGCVGKAQRVGGWSSVGGHSRDVEGLLPAGSVLFVECDDVTRRLDALESWHLGGRTLWGYGRFLLGVARPPKDNNDVEEETR